MPSIHWLKGIFSTLFVLLFFFSKLRDIYDLKNYVWPILGKHSSQVFTELAMNNIRDMKVMYVNALTIKIFSAGPIHRTYIPFCVTIAWSYLYSCTINTSVCVCCIWLMGFNGRLISKGIVTICRPVYLNVYDRSLSCIERHLLMHSFILDWWSKLTLKNTYSICLSMWCSYIKLYRPSFQLGTVGFP